MLSKSQSDVSLLVSRISISAAKAAGSIDSPVKTSPAKITPDSPVSWQIKRRRMDGGLTRMTPFALQEVVLQLGDLLDGDAQVALWLLEGQVLSQSELSALCDLCSREPRLRIIVEMGGARSLRWQPMSGLLAS